MYGKVFVREAKLLEYLVRAKSNLWYRDMLSMQRNIENGTTHN